MKSDVNLNSRLNVGGNAIHRRCLRKNTKRTLLGACATPASEALHERLIHSLKSETEKEHFNVIMERRNVT